MMLQIPASQALTFLPFVAPLCFWTVWTDLSTMRITNKTVLLLLGVFLVVGLFVVPFPDYLWRLVAVVVMLVIGFLANMAGLMGAGDSKFLAAAAPFVAPGDIGALSLIFAMNLLACIVTHRIIRRTSLHAMAPGWKSWNAGNKFPMGFSLGSTLVIYLFLGAIWGS